MIFYCYTGWIIIYADFCSQNVAGKKFANFDDVEKNLSESNIWKKPSIQILNNSIFTKNLYNSNFFLVCPTSSYRGSIVFNY